MSDSIEWNNDPEGLVLRYLDKPREDLKDVIMVQYAGLVEKIARRFAGIEPLDDLVQVGFIGLLNALGKFDRNAGVRFNTYATYLIAGEIKHYLRDRTQTIRQPAWLQELRHKVNRTANMLQQSLGRVPTEREIAEELKVSENAVREVYATQELLKVASLDTPLQGEDDGDSEVEKLDAASFCPEQLSVEDRLLLDSAMKQLRDLERDVLMRFHFEAMNQTEIANELGISCNYVSHILRQSLTKLRKILTSEDERDRVLRRQSMEVDYELLDATTGAYTEAFFKTRLEEELHRASSSEVALGLVLVNFRGLDTLRSFYGEASVTDFMTDAADFLKGNVRRLDLVCHWGPTGFGVILPSSGNNVPLVRQRILVKMQAWMSARYAQNSPIRVEIGHASFPEDGKTSKDLFKKAVLKPVEPVTKSTKAA